MPKSEEFATFGIMILISFEYRKIKKSIFASIVLRVSTF